MDDPDRTIAARKAELRAAMRAVRDAMPPQERLERAEAVERRVLALEAVAAARTVLVFYAFGSEIPTRGLVSSLRARDVAVLLPVVHADEMHAAPYTPATPLERSALGVMQPTGGDRVDPDAIDVVLAPGLAFDRSGHRLGYGRGFYDRYLRGLGPNGLRVGIGYDEQLVERLPHDDRDERLDVIITDARAVDARS